MDDNSGKSSNLRKKFSESGLKDMSDKEILELLLSYSGGKGKNDDTAQKLLNRFGSLSSIFEAHTDDLCKIKGVSKSSAALIKLIPHFARECSFERKKKDLILNTSEAAAEFIVPQFIGKTNEHVFVVCLDKNLKYISSSFISEGSYDNVTLNVREIARFALENSADNIILAHNHTQGIAFPSAADINATRRVKDTLKRLSIILYDHIVVAREDYYSMKDHNDAKL